MKTQLKRLSKSTLAVILSVCLLVSCMTVGIIATDAAKTADERVGDNEVNKDFIYVDISACSDKTIDGLNCWWDTGCTNWGEWITTKEDMGNYVYKFVFTNSSHTYFRGFKVEFTDGVKVSVAVPSNNSNDMITINADRTAGTWGTYVAPVTTATYTVVGDENLMGTGNAWAPTNTNFDMTEDNGTYSYTFPNAISAGTYLFKIAKDHAWTVTKGYGSDVTGTSLVTIKDEDGKTEKTGSNIQLTVSEAANITITYTPTGDGTGAVYINAVSNETKYTVTIDAGSYGSVSTNSMQVGATAKALPTVTGITDGYSFKEWTVTSGGSDITLTNATANDGTATVSASGAGTVTATYNAPVYTIVGEAGLMGSAWDTNGNVMIDNRDGTFSYTVTGVNAGTYNYKAIRNHDSSEWEYPSGYGNNNSVEVTNNNSSVTFTLNPATPSLTAVVSGGEYSVTTSAENGTAYISRSTPVTGTETSVTIQASEGSQTVYVKATPAAGYEVAGWQKDGVSVTPTIVATDGDTKTASFAVSGATEIKPAFAKKSYSVTIASGIANGTVTASPSSAQWGSTVTLTATPASGYRLATITATDAGSNPVTVTNNTFTMPQSNVTVTATFEEIPYVLGYRVSGAAESTNTNVNFSNGSAAITLDANTTYEFWIKYGDTTYKDQNAGTMTRANSTAWPHTSGNQGNTKLSTDLAGTYTFTFSTTAPVGTNSKDGSEAVGAAENIYVSVTYPPETNYTVTFANGDYGTVSPASATVSNVSGYDLSNETVTTTGFYKFKEWTVTSGTATIRDGKVYPTTNCTLTATYESVPAMYAIGGKFGDKSTSNTSYPMSYDSNADAYYITVVPVADTDNLFRFHDGTDEYAGNGGTSGAGWQNYQIGTSSSKSSLETISDYNTKGCFYFDFDNGGHISGATYKVWFDKANMKAWAEVESMDLYLTGWLNGESVTTTDDSRKFTKQQDGTYKLDYTFTGNQGGAQYVTVFDGTNAYHPASHESGTGTAGTTVNTNPGDDPKWKVVATTDQTVHFTYNPSTKVLSWTVDSLATKYRVVGSATFFGTAWDTSTASSSYKYMMEASSGTQTADGKSFTYDYRSGPHTANAAYGSFDFKVFGTDNTWKPENNVTVPGLKKEQKIYFYFNSDTGDVTYAITGEGSADVWPPADIQSKTLGNVRYDSLIYNISGGSNNITTDKTTLDGLQQETGSPDGWWADFSSILPTIGTNQLYFNITSNGNYTGFYSTSNSTIDLSNAPGVNAAKMTDNSGKYFVELSGIDSTVTNLGVYITKDGDNKFTYKVYTIKGSSSASKTVKIYAKDGAIRRLGTARDPRSNITYSTFEQHANTFLTDSTYNTRMTGAVRASTHGASGTDEWTDSSAFDRYTYDYTTGVEKGSTIYIKTVLKNDDYMNQYYLAGYSINGTTYVEHTVAESETGTVTESFTIPEDWEWNYVEITPIYFLRNSEKTIKFYVEGYDQTVMDAGWGNTVGVYPYYQDPTNNSQVANVNNPFGGYPGQPLMFYKGNYYAVLPKSYQAYTEAHTSGEKVDCEIKGVTLSNMYWDDVHLYTGEVSSHFQTYDFDDLYKIYKEYGDDVNNIICAFKYRTQKNNDEPNSVTPANYTNGWEVLKDYYGNPIDIFGNVLKDSALAKANAITTAEQAQNATNVVRVISQDYKSNCAGQYATEYAIYDTTGAQVKVDGGKSTIVPSALAIRSDSNFDNYDPATKAFKAIYQALDSNSNVKGQPVVITYEKSIYGGGEKADRCDARWFFSKRGEAVNATTRIEYSDDLGATWNTDSFNSGTATGSHTGSTAYFTGLSTEADNTPETLAGNTTTTDTSANTNLTPRIGEGYYVFTATAGTQYEFVGWYILRENYQQNADKNHLTSHAEIAKDGDIFVARFVKTAHGSFTINHKLHPQSSGFGDVYVQATVKNSGNTLYTIGSVDPKNNPTSTVTIEKDGNNNDLIVSGHGNIIEAKFVPDPYGTSSFVNFYATVNDLLNGYNGYDFVKSIEINMPGVGDYDSSKGIYALVTYDVDKMFAATSGMPTQIYTSVTHYSKFDLKTNVHYNLKYTFNTRYYGAKNYEYSQSFTEAELRSYFYDQITQKSVTEITIDKQFVYSKAPNESNFRQDLTWRIGDVHIEGNTGTLTAYQVDKKTVDGIVYDSEIKNGQYGLVTKRMTTGYMKLFDTTTNATDQTAETFNPADENLYRPFRTTYLDNGEEKTVYLHHWDVYQLDSFTYDTTNSFDELGNLKVDTTKSKLVAQSYSSKFNYVGFEDYAIVPVYTSVYVNRQEISDSRTDSSATLLTITRNHWNNTTSGNADSGSYNQPNTNYDRIYVDFMLNYNYSKKVDGKLTNVLLNSTDPNIKVGFVVKSYTVEDGHKVYREGKSQTVLVDKSKIDNKNRLEYCYGFNNTQNNSQWGLNFEFTPFIVDTNNQSDSTGASIKIDNNTYKALYSVADKDVLDGVNFYVIGKADTAWS